LDVGLNLKELINLFDVGEGRNILGDGRENRYKFRKKADESRNNRKNDRRSRRLFGVTV
jgi:hypothetical protein